MQRIKKETVKEKIYRAAARIFYERDGEIEIDDNAAVSIGSDNGAYVQAWIWVSDDDVDAIINGKRMKGEI